MLLLGARSTSAEELRKGLSFDRLDVSNETSVHHMFSDLIKSSVMNRTSVALANYLLIKEEANETDALQKYKTDVQTLYGAKVDDVNFSANGSAIQATVNNWVNETTAGRITSIIDSPLGQDVAALLLNAISFKGEWDQKFMKGNTEKMKFMNHGVNETEADFMTKHEKYFPFKEATIGDHNVSILEMDYKQDSMSMVIILPEENDGLQKILSSCNFSSDMREVLQNLEKGLISKEMNLYIPKFKFNANYSLIPTLQSMGIREIFTNRTDLSGINGYDNLFVSDVKHKAVVNMDEDGTEAAAVMMIEVMTRVGGEPTTPPIEFKADHPFMFVIRNKSDGLVYFMGRIESL